MKLVVMTDIWLYAESATMRGQEIRCIKIETKMKINVKDLKVGDVFKKDGSELVFKVMEISETPLFTFGFAKIYPIICDAFNPVVNKTAGYLKLEDNVTEVDLLYRNSEIKYVTIKESFESIINERTDKEDES